LHPTPLGRFLSRCLPIDFSSYGMAGEIAEYLEKVWHAEGGNGNGPDFARLSKECRNNVRDSLGRLEVELWPCKAGRESAANDAQEITREKIVPTFVPTLKTAA
jgi:hypothetical protein